MKVTYYFREQRAGNYSIEMLFTVIMSFLKTRIKIYKVEVPRRSSILKMLSLCVIKSDIHHITGDVNYIAFFLKGSKTVLTVHDIGHYDKTLSGWRKYVYKKVWLDWPLNKVNQITAVSHFTKQELVDKFNIEPNKINVVYNAKPLAFNYIPQSFNTDKPKILQIGSGRNKNIHRLIEAVEGLSCELILIRKKDVDLELLLKSKNITYSWFTNLTYEGVIKQYASCDMLFFASEYEGFGMPIIEANAVGRPVVTGNCASMPEVAGKAACIVDSFNVQSIRDGILKIINDSAYRTVLIDEGLDNVKRFDLAKISEQYLAIYRSIYNS